MLLGHQETTPPTGEPMPRNRHILTAILMAATATSCSPIPRVEYPPELVRLPLATQLLHKGETLTAIRIEVDCAGLTGIRNVPDGWQYRINADGERYTADIVPP
jgi:hypothetical protein